MALGTTKSFAFAATYTSTTLNANEALNYGQNGVLTGCTVTTVTGTVSIAPGTFIQNGIKVSFTNTLTATAPTELATNQPYSVIVSTSSSMQNLGEVITPTFAFRPEDLTANSVIVADWDGYEWIQRPLLQIAGIIEAEQTQAIDESRVGIQSGFDCNYTSSDVVVNSGSLVDQQGYFFTKTLPTTFVPVADDVDSLGRVDNVVYRRGDESSNRPGSLQYITGPCTDSTGDFNDVLHKVTLSSITGLSGESVPSAVKVLSLPSNNSTFFVFLATISSVQSVYIAETPDSMGTPVLWNNAAAVATVTAADATLTPDGYLDIIYTRSNQVYYQRFGTPQVISGSYTNTSTAVIAETQVATHSTATGNPRMVTIGNSSSYFNHVVYELTVSGSVHNLYYARFSAITSTFASETPATILISISAVATNPSIDKDDLDQILYLAYENSTSGVTYYAEYDATTATGSAVPTQIGTTLALNTDIIIDPNGSSSVLSPTSGGTNAIVRRSANQETYVFWRQNKGSSLYGIAVYNRRYLSLYGHLAVIQDLKQSGENISVYDVRLDGLSNAYFLMGTAVPSASTYIGSLALETITVPVTAFQLDTTTATSVALRFTTKGALVHTWGYSNSLFDAKTPAGAINNMRSFTALHTDVLLCQYNSVTNALAVRGNIIGQDTSVLRLYEFLASFASVPQIGWGTVAANTVSWTSAITLQFFNRNATYTIASNSGGTSLASGNALYVIVPDADSAVTLTVYSAAFGTGIIDRHGKDIRILCWNINGVLYTPFAPYRLLAGESVSLGTTTQAGFATSESVTVGESITVPISDSGSGITGPAAVYLSQGSADGSRTAGSAYRVDATNGTGVGRYLFAGFLTNSYSSTYSSAGAGFVANAGILTGFTGLVAGTLYYADPGTLGGITSTIPVTSGYYVVPVGIAVSTTSLLINAALGASAALIASTSYGINTVKNEAQLTTAITTANSTGGVIILGSSFTCSSAHTIPTNTMLLGQVGSTVLTLASSGAFTLSDNSRLQDVFFTTALTSGSMVTLANNYSVVRGCQFTVQSPSTSTGNCINVTGNANRMYNNVFVGVAGDSGEPYGINYSSGLDNIDDSSVFLP